MNVTVAVAADDGCGGGWVVATEARPGEELGRLRELLGAAVRQYERERDASRREEAGGGEVLCGRCAPVGATRASDVEAAQRERHVGVRCSRCQIPGSDRWYRRDTPRASVDAIREAGVPGVR